jgi:C-terminal peptidase prc
MFRLSVVLFSIIIIGNFALADDQETPVQYWQETGLNLNFIGQKIQGDCAQSAVNYLACVQGVNVAASFLNPAASFASPAEAAKNPDLFGAVIKSYGAYNLYVMKPAAPSKNYQANWARQKGIRAVQLEAANAAYNTPGKNINFAGILNELKPQLIQGELANSEGYIAAAVYNTYLTSAVDPHTHIDPTKQVQDELKSTDVVYFGIGATLQMVDDQLVIKSPKAGSPSLEAGVRAKDVITTVDGVSVKGQTINQVVKKLKGPEGTSVKVGLLRKGQPLDVTIVRKKIEFKNVEASVVIDSGSPIGYIKLTNFMEEKACQTIASYLSVFKKMGAKGLIFDLRDDGGGLLQQAVCIGSLFVGKLTIVTAKTLDGKQSQRFFWDRDAVTDLPMVTLVNSGSASASEILAGALQDYKRSWIAGSTSFGKASVQGQSDFAPGVVLFHTIERFYQPSGRTNQAVGISPDFQIDPVPNATADEKFELHEADYYTNALPALSAPWVEQRPADVAKIQACMKASGLADKAYQAKSDDAIAPDYQLITSQVILSCQNQ